ncbi:Uu.00g050920.m01.CDS01 [Anthostomella pinea]|uniref:Uu.00g050920.m01.CDS01 n=1 Tax=Anthostomella pinea TaxID=933095 RepID=A0AAI8VTD8_9PEZI|nr:Uu.00g050920.m01.CDS01 [Anthostomella pinea]
MFSNSGALCSLLLLAGQSFGSPLFHRDSDPSLDWLSLCDQKAPEYTPLDKPLVSWSVKAPEDRHPRVYLKKYYDDHDPGKPYGRKVARWLSEFYNPNTKVKSDLEFKHKPNKEPIRKDAATLVTIFYPPDDNKDQTEYLNRFTILANAQEQIVVYTTEGMVEKIKKIRDDDHIIIRTDFKTVWDFPNNAYQQENFDGKQKQLYWTFSRNLPKSRTMDWFYNQPHRMATYNAKAAVAFDAIMRNEWGSDKWVLIDFGIFHSSIFRFNGPAGKKWEAFTKVLFDQDKLARSIKLTGNTGVVVGEYTSRLDIKSRDFTDECWTDKTHQGNCLHFVANVAVGSTLGMLEYVTKFMKTVDDMDAAGWYVAREELVMSPMAARYPNTLVAVPEYDLAPELYGPLQRLLNTISKIKKQNAGDARAHLRFASDTLSWSSYGGAEQVPPLQDPFTTRFCPKGSKYQPRQPNLEQGKGIVKDDPEAVEKEMMGDSDSDYGV